MNQKDIDRLLTCRKIIDSHNDNRVNLKDDAAKMAAVENYIITLKANGFSSVQNFENFNRFMNMCAYLECRPLQGKCDKCSGYKETPPCLEKWGDNSCYSVGQVNVDDNKTLVAADTFVKGLQTTKNKITKVFCPEGHGFYNDEALCKPLPFDITWSVFK
jgi:hypothetical protein